LNPSFRRTLPVEVNIHPAVNPSQFNQAQQALRRCLPFIDERLRKAAGTPTKSQAFAARRIAAALRWLANTRAMDYAILLGLRRVWPKGQTISTEVKMCL